MSPVTSSALLACDSLVIETASSGLEELQQPCRFCLALVALSFVPRATVLQVLRRGVGKTVHLKDVRPYAV